MRHRHHIIPKHMGGSNDPSNLIEVSLEEHAELHLALYLEHGKWQDWVAFTMLSGQVGKEEGIAMVCRMAAQQPRSESFKRKISEANRRRGPHSEETKRRIREGRKGQPGNWTGKKFSQEHRENLSRAKTGLVLTSLRKTFRLTFRDGCVIEVTGITAWCKENGYDYGSMKRLMSGRLKTYKNLAKCERLDK